MWDDRVAIETLNDGFGGEIDAVQFWLRLSGPQPLAATL